MTYDPHAAPDDAPAITHARLTGQPRDDHTDTTSLPAVLPMDNRELNRWHAHYSAIERAGLDLSDAESAHRDLVERSVRLRDDALRFTISRH